MFAQKTGHDLKFLGLQGAIMKKEELELELSRYLSEKARSGAALSTSSDSKSEEIRDKIDQQLTKITRLIPGVTSIETIRDMNGSDLEKLYLTNKKSIDLQVPIKSDSSDHSQTPTEMISNAPTFQSGVPKVLLCK